MSTIRSKKKIKTTHVIILLIIITLFMESALLYTLNQYEQGIIELQSTQQDSYISLMVKQINLKKMTADEISNLLGDTNNQYWAFSDNDSLLYVKNVIETNTYKKINIDEYFKSKGADKFISTLNDKQVIHKILTLDGHKYIVSGTIFKNNGEEYKLCLLTDEDILLSNNTFLNAKIKLCIVFAVMNLLTIFLTIILVLKYNYNVKDNNKAYNENTLLTSKVHNFDYEIRLSQAYDSRENVFESSALNATLKHLRNYEEALPLSVLLYKYEDYKERNALIHSFVFGQKDLKFIDNSSDLFCVILMQCSLNELFKVKAQLKGYNLVHYSTEKSVDALRNTINKYIKIDHKVKTYKIQKNVVKDSKS